MSDSSGDFVLTEEGKRVKRRAMHLLERMDRTEHQLREKLAKSNYPEELVEDAIVYVKSYHYLDDVRYTQNYVRYHSSDKSRVRLKQDLMQKGVNRQIIDEVLEEEFQGDERAMIQRLLEKKHYSSKMDQKEKQRIYNFLLRRGFQHGDISSVMKADLSDYE